VLLIIEGRLIPPNIPGRSYFYLITSGIIGLTLGDLCLFTAFVIIGARRSLLIFSVSPIIAALIAWFLLDEKLSPYAVAGIFVTVLGIWWVIAERQKNGDGFDENKKLAFGVILAVGGAFGQAAGLVLAKAGMDNTIEPLPATFIRMVAAALAIWLIGIIKQDNFITLRKLKDMKIFGLILGGGICGPFLGVWLSLVSVKYTEAGIAAAIMATVPVIIIPLVIIFYKEKVSLRALIGAVITAGGVAILFLS
jgi:drug/metabolite transporter (DMT)-like permease